MDLDKFIYIFVGSTFGLILRLFIKYKLRTQIIFFLNNSLVVNVLSSLFLGIFIALSPNNNNLLLLFSVGFLGCLSTFSSFIYQLFDLIRKGNYPKLLIYYIQVLTFSFIFFCLGYFITLFLKE